MIISKEHITILTVSPIVIIIVVILINNIHIFIKIIIIITIKISIIVIITLSNNKYTHINNSLIQTYIHYNIN